MSEDKFKLKLNMPEKMKQALKNPQGELSKTLRSAIEKSLIIMQGEVKKNIVPGWNAGFKRGLFTGALNRSVTYRMSGNKGVLGVNKIYGRIQEEGGTITPKTAKALYVPLTSLGRKKGKGSKFGIDFVLSKMVKIKPKKYFKRGIESGLPKVRAILNEVIKEMAKRMGF